MKKRLMALLVCVLLLVMVIPSVANAQGNDPAPVSVASSMYARYTGAQLATLERMVASANRQIEIAVKFAQLTPWNDVAWLQNLVESITAPVFAYANAIGAVVVCEYTAYYIDGQYVMVDPLRVIPL